MKKKKLKLTNLTCTSKPTRGVGLALNSCCFVCLHLLFCVHKQSQDPRLRSRYTLILR